MNHKDFFECIYIEPHAIEVKMSVVSNEEEFDEEEYRNRSRKIKRQNFPFRTRWRGEKI